MEYALITGASSGIGFALAAELAKRGYGLLLVSANQTRLQDAVARLRGAAVPVRGICADLSERGAGTALYAAVRKTGLTVTVLVNNAGVGLIGDACLMNGYRETAMLRLNVLTPTDLCRLFLGEFRRKGRGRILNVASVGAFQPGPYTAAYYASKSYLYQYSRAIRVEAAQYDVSVCTLCPGSTASDFFRRAGADVPKHALPPEKVAAYACRKFFRNQAVIIPGICNRWMRIIPQPIRIAAIARMKRPRNPIKDAPSDKKEGKISQ